MGIMEMDKGREAEKDVDRVMMEKKDTQIEEQKETIEHWKQEVARVNASMEGMEISHKKKVGTITENHMKQTEEENTEKLRLKIKIVDLEEKNKNDVRVLEKQIETLKKARGDMNTTLRNRDTEIRENKAVIEGSRRTISNNEEEVGRLKVELEKKNKAMESYKEEVRTYRMQCRVLGCKQGSIGTDMNPIHTERVVDTPAVREEGKEIESELETTGNSYLDLNSSTAGTFGDTSNINTTHGPQSPPLGISIRRKTEKRKKVEERVSQCITKARQGKEGTAQCSSEDGSAPQRDEDNKGPPSELHCAVPS